MNIWWKLSSQWFFNFLEFDEIYISGAIHHRLKPLIYWLIILVCNYFQNENILKIFPRYKIYNVRLRTSIFMNKWTDIAGLILYSTNLNIGHVWWKRDCSVGGKSQEITVGQKSVGGKSPYTVPCTYKTIFKSCQMR